MVPKLQELALTLQVRNYCLTSGSQFQIEKNPCASTKKKQIISGRSAKKKLNSANTMVQSDINPVCSSNREISQQRLRAL